DGDSMFALAMVKPNTATQPAFAQVEPRARLLSSSALAGGTLRGLALAAGLAATAPMLAPSEAAAQFVCGGSTDGAEPQTGAGATAAVGGVACGPLANANGGAATAVGEAATANGTIATAVGFSSVANGAAFPIAVGGLANANGGSAIAIGGLATAN